MPNIKSAKKRVKVTKVKTERNRAYKSELRTLVKHAMADGVEETAYAVKSAIKKLDESVSKGILHRNTAARKKAAIIRKCRVK